MNNRIKYMLLIMAAVMLAAAPAVMAKAHYEIATEQEYIMDSGSWQLLNDIAYTYNKSGLVSECRSVFRVEDGADAETGEVIFQDHVQTDAYRYNSKGLLTSQITKTDGKETFRKTVSYDRKMNVLSEKNYNDRKITDSYVNTYDKKGNMTRSVHRNYAEGKKTTVKIRYDQKGNPVKRTETDKDGNYVSVTTYQYYYKGKKLIKETEQFDNYAGIDGDFILTTTYHTNGKVKKSSMKSAAYSWTETFDRKGRQTGAKHKWTANNYTSVSKYNKKGLLVKETMREAGLLNVETYKYKTGKNGIDSMTVYYNGEAVRMKKYTYVKVRN